jgi:ABC-type Zn uptake system ZnuABC Zn-binding protein ZnuA
VRRLPETLIVVIKPLFQAVFWEVYMKKSFIIIKSLALVFSLLTACSTTPTAVEKSSEQTGLKVLAAESFLADIAQNVAGDRVKVETLMPLGMDPHAFEPVPQDVSKITESDLVIINGGIEGWLEKVIANAGGSHRVLEASAGLTSRTAREGEHAEGEEHGGEDHEGEDHEGEDHEADEHAGEENHNGHSHGDIDPHFWLDPINVIHYVENIQDGLIEVDPDGKDTYTANANAYITRLKELDAAIREKVNLIPVEKRLIVTNHESFGYFADRYGFKIVGTIIPSVSSGASPSAQQLARLVDDIRSSGASAIFLETATNPQLAEQISSETGVRVVTELYTHSITPADGKAPTYIDMMKYNINSIVENLK